MCWWPPGPSSVCGGCVHKRSVCVCDLSPRKRWGFSKAEALLGQNPSQLTVLPSMEGGCELFTYPVHSGTASTWQGGQEAPVFIRCLLTHAKLLCTIDHSCPQGVPSGPPPEASVVDRGLVLLGMPKPQEVWLHRVPQPECGERRSCSVHTCDCDPGESLSRPIVAGGPRGLAPLSFEAQACSPRGCLPPGG